MEDAGQTKKTFKLFNITNGELFTLDTTTEDLDTIIIALLKGKYDEPTIKTDEEFIQMCTESTNDP